MIKITNTTPSHAKKIYELMQFYNLPLWSMESITAECTRDNTVLLTATDNDEIIGVIAISTVLDEAELNFIAVSEIFLSCGVGNLLLKEAIKILKQKSINTLMLEVRKNNNKAVRYYEKNGFVKVGARKNYYENPSEDALLYNLNINTEENFDTK